MSGAAWGGLFGLLVGLLFLNPLLGWATGRRDTDGPWAPHWYAAVESSTGFGPSETDSASLPDAAQRVADRCRPYYDRLAQHRIRA